MQFQTIIVAVIFSDLPLDALGSCSLPCLKTRIIPWAGNSAGECYHMVLAVHNGVDL